ncbi:MAG TPA: hypothetical protein PLR02_00775 [Rhodocyclaceae bacterium]|nr:hypothetical protein [Rhodocyclaceae bacterium]
MKKKLLAVSVAATLGFGAGVANAQVAVAENGVGQVNILPYYSVQSGNATLVHITNTDTVNGKAVKVRFRGAEWSDDVFDFQVFLSPGDIFTGAVEYNGNTGLAKFSTSDNSCTLPANVNRDFVDQRLHNKATGTLEGYVEVLTLADIPENTAADSLYTTIKHVDGVAPCDFDILKVLVQDTGTELFQGLTVPTGSLLTFGTIINVPESKAFTVAATAVDYVAANKIFFRQANERVTTPTWFTDLTADDIFNVIPLYAFDLPDLTTPVVGVTPTEQRDLYADALAKNGVAVEYVGDPDLSATTDVVFSQPVRRFFYDFVTPGGSAGRYEIAPGVFAGIYGTGKYAGLVGSENRIGVGSATFWDREENTVVSETDIVISPTPPSAELTYSLKGEVSIISINNGEVPTGSLAAELTANNYDSGLESQDGWATLSLTNRSNGEALPVIGYSAINLRNTSIGAAGTNYGNVLPLRGYAAPAGDLEPVEPEPAPE